MEKVKLQLHISSNEDGVQITPVIETNKIIRNLKELLLHNDDYDALGNFYKVAIWEMEFDISNEIKTIDDLP